MEVVPEEADVVMWSEGFFSVFAAHVEPNGVWFDVVAEAFEEVLNVFVVERDRRGIAVGESEEAVMLVHFGFVYAACCPFAGAFEAAFNALAAG